MISKFSVKKPFTVLVAVILILVLGAVSVTRMTPDLLPEMSFPYIVLVTTYVGAAPEEVENTVSIDFTVRSYDRPADNVVTSLCPSENLFKSLFDTKLPANAMV